MAQHQREAQREGVDIRYYDVIYKLTDDIQAALVGMLDPTFREVIEVMPNTPDIQSWQDHRYRWQPLS